VGGGKRTAEHRPNARPERRRQCQHDGIERPARNAGPGGIRRVRIRRAIERVRFEEGNRGEGGRNRAGGRDPLWGDLFLGRVGGDPVCRRFRSSTGGCYSGTAEKKKSKFHKCSFPPSHPRRRVRGFEKHNPYPSQRVGLVEVFSNSPELPAVPRRTTTGFIPNAAVLDGSGKVPSRHCRDVPPWVECRPELDAASARTGGDA
jgi:hypothetical protein